MEHLGRAFRLIPSQPVKKQRSLARCPNAVYIILLLSPSLSGLVITTCSPGISQSLRAFPQAQVITVSSPTTFFPSSPYPIRPPAYRPQLIAPVRRRTAPLLPFVMAGLQLLVQMILCWGFHVALTKHPQFPIPPFRELTLRPPPSELESLIVCWWAPRLSPAHPQ